MVRWAGRLVTSAPEDGRLSSTARARRLANEGYLSVTLPALEVDDGAGEGSGDPLNRLDLCDD